MRRGEVGRAVGGKVYKLEVQRLMKWVVGWDRVPTCLGRERPMCRPNGI